jgi:hypothetical protein
LPGRRTVRTATRSDLKIIKRKTHFNRVRGFFLAGSPENICLSRGLCGSVATESQQYNPNPKIECREQKNRATTNFFLLGTIRPIQNGEERRTPFIPF